MKKIPETGKTLKSSLKRETQGFPDPGSLKTGIPMVRLPVVSSLRTLFLLTVLALTMISCSNKDSDRVPNIVIIFLDDSGWSDFEPFGELYLETPNVEQLANEGCSFRNFYVPQAVCSASRAALMTGCYPGRTGVFGAHGPRAKGLDPGFATMGEVFKSAGYNTAIFGKWHCGDQEGTRSHDRGFDESCGLMYSNDMWKFHPGDPVKWGKYPLWYWENGKVIIEDVTKEYQKNLTRWYTEHAVDFINRHKGAPFLLYVPHSMPHVPLFCSKEFEGRSGKGLYGDVMLELDWSVGQINTAVKANNLEKNTIIVLTSDNGPWTSYGNHAGYTPFREAKATSFDGGVRSACIIKYPGHIEAGSFSTRAFFSIDLLPSFCHITGTELPENEIDGLNVWDIITGDPDAVNPHDFYAISTGRNFEGILSGDGEWKLHLQHNYRTLRFPGKDGQPGKYDTAEIDTSLYYMENDPYETDNVLEEYPDISERLINMASNHAKRFYNSTD